jgi:DNA-binding transcriptional ArsR family regulator
MTIRFLLPEDASERVAFVYSPLLEAVLSLHVLDEPKHHPYQHGWVRRARSLPPGLKAEIRALGLLCRSPLPGFLLPTSAGELAGFSGELAAMGELPDEVVATELRHILDCHTREPKPSPGNPNGPREPGRRRTIPRTTEQQPVDPDVASLILDDPPGLIERLQALLRWYWEESFAEEWERLEPMLAEGVEEAGRTIAGRGIYAFFDTLRPKVLTDRAERMVWLERPHDHEVVVPEDAHLVLAPSVYAWPHVPVNCDPPWPPQLVYPAPQIAREDLPRIPSDDLVRVLRALGDDTRLRTLRLVAERPRSTQELAQLVHLSEAATSKHLRTLADAGLVRGRREGFYVLYGLADERLRSVGAAIAAFLHDHREP